MDDERVAQTAKALAHPVRVRIARLLASQAECSGKEVFASLPLAQSTISQHLAVLRQAGVVTDHAVGTSRVYCLNAETLAHLAREIEALAAQAASCSDSARSTTKG